jgi:ferredoxin
MNTGPRAHGGFDLALTELVTGDHRFLVEVGTELGASIMAKVPHSKATQVDDMAADRLLEQAAQNMGRDIDMGGLKTALYDRAGDSHWEEIAARCLACGNCTMSCPTCFCTTVHDTTDLTTTRAERTQLWDSCFSLDFSYIHGGSVRQSVMSRYRQWMTHKLASWDDQFGAPGCVGCGRCIAWCPVGIDITDEAKIFRSHDINTQGGNR